MEICEPLMEQAPAGITSVSKILKTKQESGAKPPFLNWQVKVHGPDICARIEGNEFELVFRKNYDNSCRLHSVNQRLADNPLLKPDDVEAEKLWDGVSKIINDAALAVKFAIKKNPAEAVRRFVT